MLMMHKLKILINNILSVFNVRLVKLSSFKKLSFNEKNQSIINLISLIKQPQLSKFVQNINFSKSQLAQDLFVLCELNFKKDGFFVEFGAANGLDNSNTFILENNFNWKGILAEPAKQWHKELIKNRGVFIEKACVWQSSNKTLVFNEIGELSTLDSFSNKDKHAEARRIGSKYKVKTISLEDLLGKYNAPAIIDYLSIDTEGSEFEILCSFNFEKYKFKVITCEHNFTSNREKIFNLLTSKGYVRKYSNISNFDDWFVLKK